jgi:transposase-like protein
MNAGPRIDYKTLRKVNPEAARLAVLECLKTNGGNKAEAARVFGINRSVVYDILEKQAEGDLKDRSRTPKHQPNRTPDTIEERVVKAKSQTRLGPKRLSLYLQRYEAITVPAGTIRHILRRNRDKLAGSLSSGRRKREKREFVDWYSAKPFEVVQMDVKYIRDQKALSQQQIIHLDCFGIPNYQWGAMDVNSRFKLIAYSRERSWTNGLCFYLWVISWLRSHGVTAEIVFTVDNGEEFGGKSWLKVKQLRKLIAGFGCRLIQNHKGHPEENAHLERSHRTDDDEFYKSRAFAFRCEHDLLEEAMGYIYYYNNVREHSSLDYQTPFAHLIEQQPELHDDIRYVQPIILDDASVALGPWSGYNLLAQHRLSTVSIYATVPHPNHRIAAGTLGAEIAVELAAISSQRFRHARKNLSC